MAKASLDLESPADLALLNNAVWRYGAGWAPDEPNEGLVSQAAETPALLRDYDDSGWETLDDVAPGGDDPTSGGADDPGIRKARSVGFTFGWYRVRIRLPERIGDFEVAGSQLWFETNIDEGGLHTWQDTRYATLVDVVDQTTAGGAFDIYFLKNAVLDQRCTNFTWDHIDEYFLFW